MCILVRIFPNSDWTYLSVFSPMGGGGGGGGGDADQYNSDYGHFLGSDNLSFIWIWQELYK